jgi:hypothetical protein
LPTLPPRNEDDETIPHDHVEVVIGATLIRRISEAQTIVVDGRKRISTIAYKGSTDPGGSMSVDILPFILEDGYDPREWVTSPRWIGSVQFNCGFLRELNLLVGYDPIPPPATLPVNPYHGAVWGNFTKAVQKQIQHAATWFVEIPEVNLI